MTPQEPELNKRKSKGDSTAFTNASLKKLLSLKSESNSSLNIPDIPEPAASTRAPVDSWKAKWNPFGSTLKKSASFVASTISSSLSSDLGANLDIEEGNDEAHIGAVEGSQSIQDDVEAGRFMDFFNTKRVSWNGHQSNESKINESDEHYKTPTKTRKVRRRVYFSR